MTEPVSPPLPGPCERATGWVLILGLAGVLGWTTLCLGGYRPETMVVSGPAVLGLAALAAVWHAARPCRLNRVWLWPLPFLLYALASVLWLAPAQWLAWREWLLWLQMWLVFGLTLHFARTPGQVRLLIGTALGLGLVGVGMAAYQRYADPAWLMLGRTQAGQFSTRSAGMFGIPNSLAGLIELLLPACLVLPFSRAVRPTTKVLCLWLAGLLLFALVLTGSRGGWIALAGAILLWPLLGMGDWRRRLAGAGAVLAVLVGGAALLYRFSPPVHERVQPFLTGEFELSRPIMWRTALAIWRGQPWLGTGAASFNVLFETHRPRGFLTEPQWTHNDYLNTLSDYGVVGFALWLAAGAGLLVQGWRVVRGARQQPQGGDFFQLWRWKFGLWLGLVAFALHLAVDFHTKIPALAFLAAVSAGLLLQRAGGEEPWPAARWGRRTAALLLALGLGGLALGKALPLYRAETARYAARQAIDKFAVTGKGSHQELIMAGVRQFRRAVVLDPGNAQAWSDLAYATIQAWPYTGKNLAASGRQALVAADEAVKLCPQSAEFWVRRGAAQDMVPDADGASRSFAMAISLAPNNPEWRFYQAYHLAAYPSSEAEALRAVETCLSLDPSYSPAISLRQRLQAKKR